MFSKRKKGLPTKVPVGESLKGRELETTGAGTSALAGTRQIVRELAWPEHDMSRCRQKASASRARAVITWTGCLILLDVQGFGQETGTQGWVFIKTVLSTRCLIGG